MEMNSKKDKKPKIEKPFKEIELENEIFYMSFIDNNSKIAIGMPNNIIEIYSFDLSQKLLTINNQPSSYFTELSDKIKEKDVTKIKLLCCSYNYILIILEIIIIKDKVGYNLLHSFHPKESRNEISKAIELTYENKNIVSIDENNIIIYEYIEDENYFEFKKIQTEGANDILNLNQNLFCVSLKTKGIIQFYDTEKFELIKEVEHIETYGCNNYLNKLNERFLFVGGFDYISLIDIKNKQLNTKMELIKFKERITCSYSLIDENKLLVGTKYKKSDNEYAFDIIIYKLNENNVLEEVKRYVNAHNKIINAIIYKNGTIISCSEDRKIKIWT